MSSLRVALRQSLALASSDSPAIRSKNDVKPGNVGKKMNKKLVERYIEKADNSIDYKSNSEEFKFVKKEIEKSIKSVSNTNSLSSITSTKKKRVKAKTKSATSKAKNIDTESLFPGIFKEMKSNVNGNNDFTRNSDNMKSEKSRDKKRKRNGGDSIAIDTDSSKLLLANINDSSGDVSNKIKKKKINPLNSSTNNSSSSDRRTRLEHVCTVADAVNAIGKAKRIVVISGAGISVSCGIPDFRSKESGLYKNLNCAEIGIPTAELLFDYEYFKSDPEPFYKFAKRLIPTSTMLPSFSHDFIALLDKKNKLLRNFTQNIDGLERKAGISEKRIVECHGSMSTMTCISCRKKHPLDPYIDLLMKGDVCYCYDCNKKEPNLMKPAITFFGENIAKSVMQKVASDVDKCDLLIVVGTSLKVGGSVDIIIHGVASTVPIILINYESVQVSNKIRGSKTNANKEPLKQVNKSKNGAENVNVDQANSKNDTNKHDGFDVELLGYSDDILKYICNELNWVCGKDIESSSSKIDGFHNSPALVDLAVPELSCSNSDLDITTGTIKNRKKSAAVENESRILSNSQLYVVEELEPRKFSIKSA
jgi:NAD-dependent SIR2 family protein deacetylase